MNNNPLSNNRIAHVMVMVFALIFLLVSPEMPAQSEKMHIAAGAGTELSSRYIWRGYDLPQNNQPVIQTYLFAKLLPLGVSVSSQLSMVPIDRTNVYSTQDLDEITVRVLVDNSRARLGPFSVRGGVSIHATQGVLTGQYGSLIIEPFAGIKSEGWLVNPGFSIYCDTTPGQTGFYTGIDISGDFTVLNQPILYYCGVFNPHNYLKQDGGDFFRLLIKSGLIPALYGLIPQDAEVSFTLPFSLGSDFTLTIKSAVYLVFPTQVNSHRIEPVISADFRWSPSGPSSLYRDLFR